MALGSLPPDLFGVASTERSRLCDPEPVVGRCHGELLSRESHAAVYTGYASSAPPQSSDTVVATRPSCSPAGAGGGRTSPRPRKAAGRRNRAIHDRRETPRHRQSERASNSGSAAPSPLSRVGQHASVSAENQLRVFKQKRTRASIRGTSMRTPTTVARAAPDESPKSITAVAIATSK